MKPMKVGLIGCGGVANLHMNVYKSMKDVDIVGVCDLSRGRASFLAHKFGVKKIFENYNDLFEIKDLNLVDICTPVSTHARIICDAAKAVPAILVEKPMALSVAECDKIIKEVKKQKTKLCVIHQQIFLPSVEKAKSMIDRRIYDLISFRTIQKESFEHLKTHGLAADWMTKPEQKGIIWEVCCHLVYLQLHFLPNIKQVYAVGGKAKYSVYDHFVALLRTNEEPFGVIDLSWMSRGAEIVYEIFDSTGRKAQIYRDFDYLVENQAAPPVSVGKVLRGFFEDEKITLCRWAKFGVNYIKKRRRFPHFKLISNYLLNIKKDLPPPVSSEDGRKTINLLECIEKSLNEGRPITVEH